MSSSNQVAETSQASRTDLIAAFKRVVSLSRCPQATDLHVRKLLSYVCTKDSDGTGIQRSLKQLADRLLLPEATCRRVIHRAAKHFCLLTVTRQRLTTGRRTINRYSINWPAVSQLTSGIKKATTYSSCVMTTHSCHFSPSSEAGSTNTPVLLALSDGSSFTAALSDHALHVAPCDPLSGNTDVPVDSYAAPAISDHAPHDMLANVLSTSDAPALSDHALDVAPRDPLPGSADVLVGSLGLANSLNSYSLQSATALSDHAAPTSQDSSRSLSDSDRLALGSSATAAPSDQAPHDMLPNALSTSAAPALSDHAHPTRPCGSHCESSSDRLAPPALSDHALDVAPRDPLPGSTDILVGSLGLANSRNLYSLQSATALSDHAHSNRRPGSDLTARAARTGPD